MRYIEVAEFVDGEGLVWGIRLDKPLLSDVLELIELPKGATVGVNGVTKPLDYQLEENDRVEVYPKLKVDPKEKRRRLVANKRGKSGVGGVKPRCK